MHPRWWIHYNPLLGLLRRHSHRAQALPFRWPLATWEVRIYIRQMADGSIDWPSLTCSQQRQGSSQYETCRAGGGRVTSCETTAIAK